MGNIHDMSAYNRESMVVEFTELATQGLQTPMPLWMQRDKLPAWAAERKQRWADFAESKDVLSEDPTRRREEMVMAMTEQKTPKKKKAE